MSDALTDIARDNARGEAYEKYLGALKAFLVYPTTRRKWDVVKAAEAVDIVRGGYWSRGQTTLASRLEERLTALVSGDKDAWAKLLSAIKGGPLFGDFKDISPFKGKLLISVDYGQGFVTLDGDIKEFVASLIRAKNWRAYDCDRYLVALEQPCTKDAEVLWMSCGIGGVRGPRATR